MEAEYFPPKEDVILQNESPTDLYILVSGAVDLIRNVDGDDRVFKKTVAGDTFGEIGVLYNRPQPYTVRAKELSQILRLSSTSLMPVVLANPEAEQIMMSNLFMMLEGQEDLGIEYPPIETRMSLPGMHDGSNTRQNSCHLCTKNSHGEAILHDMIQKALIEFMERNNLSPFRSDQILSGTFNKRATIHHLGQDLATLQRQYGKLILLPDSFDELLKIVGEKFGVSKPTKR